MAAAIGSLYVSLTANVQPFAQGMTRAQAVTTATVGRIRRDAGIAQRSVDGFWGSLQGRGGGFRPYSLIAVSRAFDNAADRAGLLRGSLLATSAVFGGFAAALSANVVLRYADTFTNLTNQIRAVSSSAADAQARFAGIEEVARRSRSSLEATAILYSRIQKATPDRSADEILRYVETIQKTLTLGGATAQEARSAAIQFSQAIASNRLGGEELRAILETPLGLEMARALGVTIGKFREMGHAGQLTTAVMTEALSKMEAVIDEKFTKSVRTLDQAIIHVDNRFTAVIGNLNKAYGATNLLGGAIVALGDNLETIIPTMTSVLGLLGAVFIARNKMLAGGLAGGAAGAFLGNELGGLQGALIGGALGGLAGMRGPGFISTIREESRLAAQQVDSLRSQVIELRKEFMAAGQARSQAIQAMRGDPIAAARGSLQGQLARVSLDPNSSLSDIQAAKAAAVADGQRRLAAEVGKTTDRYKAFGTQLQAANTQLASVSRAATVAGQAKAFLGRSVSSLVGLFGGPWGVAITAGITLLTLMGIRAQQSAQKISEAERLIAETLNRSSEAGSFQARSAVNDAALRQLEEGRQLLKDYVEELKQAAPLFRSPFEAQSFGEIFTPVQFVREEINRLIDELAAGGISVSEFVARMETIKQAQPSFAGMAEAAQNNAQKIRDQALAVEELRKKAEELEALVRKPMELRFRIAFEGAAGDEQRFAPAGAFAEFAKQREIDTAEIVSGLNKEIQISGLKAKGLLAEAEAQRIVNDAAKEGKTVSYDIVLAKVKEKMALDEAAAALKKAGTAAETLAQKLARMKAESQGAFLPDIDREVLEQARSLKIATAEMEDYLRAAQSGDFSKAPPRLVELRDQMLYEKAAESARGIVEQYGLWSQIAPLAAAKQRELDMAVAEGTITAEQAKFAYADYLSQFQNNRWIGELTSAFGDFVKSGLDGWDSLAEGAMSFLKRIRDLIVEVLVLEPLMRSLKAAFAGGIGGGGGGFFGSIASLFTGGQAVAQGASGMGVGLNTLSTLYHRGGVVGRGGESRQIPAAALIGAPRFHGGLRSGERAGIFELGEEIITREMARREAGTVASLAALAATGGGGGDINITVRNELGVPAQGEARRGDDGRIEVILRKVEGRVAQSIGTNGVVGKAIAGNFNVQRRKR